MELDVWEDTHRRLVTGLKMDCIRMLGMGLILAALGCMTAADAQTQIHKCTDADGVVAYSQLPCVSEQPEEPEETRPDTQVKDETSAPIVEEQSPPAPKPRQESSKSDSERSACRKRYRDAIDAIDAEIGRDYSPEKAEEYKQRLLPLTRQLRQC